MNITLIREIRLELSKRGQRPSSDIYRRRRLAVVPWEYFNVDILQTLYSFLLFLGTFRSIQLGPF